MSDLSDPASLGSAREGPSGGPLFETLSLPGLELRNRLVRSATAEGFCRDDGTPDSRLAALYGDLAGGGVGLIITGHAYVLARGRCHRAMLAADRDEMIPHFAALARAAREQGARIALQINHGGRACGPDAVPDPVAPSAVAADLANPPPAQLDEAGIAEIVAAFAAAARRAREGGFDAVQIHAAHGYLAGQFLSPLSNRRGDRYGGDLPGRARFLLETLAAVREAVGPAYPVLVKLGVAEQEQGGLTAEEGAETAALLASAGAAAIETSAAGRGAIRTRVTRPGREAYLLDLARAVRRRTPVPLILVGGLRSRPVMERVLAEERIELVSLCRPFIREPDLPRRLEADPRARAACISCNRCWPEALGDGIACKAPR